MKLLKQTTYFLISLFILNSCSSDDSSSGPLPSADSFVYSYDGEQIAINNWQAIRVEDKIAVTANSATGQSFAIEFNVFGDLSSANSYSGTDVDFPLSINYVYFKSNFFDFELISLDEVNNKVSVAFSGDLYEDNFDLNSQTHFVEGSFTVSYIVQQPQVAGIGVNAVIDNNNWYSTDAFQTGGFFSGSNIELVYFSDDQYFIGIETNDDNTTEGEYMFDGDSSVNRVILYKYDVETDLLMPYQTSGTLNLMEKNVGIQLTQIIGTFDITATNGSETIEVSGGTFNMLYENY